MAELKGEVIQLERTHNEAGYVESQQQIGVFFAALMGDLDEAIKADKRVCIK